MSGSGYVKLPTSITNKKAVINMMNKKCKEGKRISEETDDEAMQCKCKKCEESEMCFKWAVTRALNPVDKNPQRVTDELREQAEKYDWEGIKFPTKVIDIHIWEISNNINVNVFGYDGDASKTYTIRIGELKDPINTINLFLYEDNHYCVVKDIGRLISAQLSESDHGKDICLRCLNAFKCVNEDIFPTKTVIRTASYEGEDMGKAFVDSLTEDLKPIYEILKSPVPVVMSERDKVEHELAKECYMCKDIFGRMWIDKKTGKPKVVKKCVDHCHITGKYRGAACNKCNLRIRVPMFVPVLFHNLEGYDSHLFVKSLGLTEGDIKCIPKTDEKYISFSKNIVMDTEIKN